ncbi:hypothetical protein Micbo1qcDRAFT_162997, partial [Microdochium bolleyi]
MRTIYADNIVLGHGKPPETRRHSELAQMLRESRPCRFEGRLAPVSPCRPHDSSPTFSCPTALPASGHGSRAQQGRRMAGPPRMSTPRSAVDEREVWPSAPPSSSPAPVMPAPGLEAGLSACAEQQRSLGWDLSWGVSGALWDGAVALMASCLGRPGGLPWDNVRYIRYQA